MAQMVEAAMRYDDPGCLVSTSGRELWVFSLENELPVPPSQFKMTVVSSGTLKPEYLASEEHIPRPWPFLTAIEGRCIAYLSQVSPPLQPFGKTSLISTDDGSLLHIKAAVTSTGELNLRLTTERANLIPAQGKESKTVWLIPSGRQALLVEASSVPSPMMSRRFLSVVQRVVHFTIDASALDESPWVRVALDGKDFMWPAALVMTIAGGNYQAGLSWLNEPDEFTALGDNMLCMQEALANAKNNAPNTAQSSVEPAAEAFPLATRGFLQQSTFRSRRPVLATASVPPPPLTPSAVNHESPAAPISIAAAAARAAAVSVPPDSVVPANEHPVYPTPGDPSPVRDWSPTSDGWDEEDITVADFNFYDAPLENEENLKEEPEQLPEATTDEPQIEANVVEEVQIEDEGKSSFSALRFPQDSLDAKYTQGGRYFTFVKEEEDEKLRDSPSTSNEEPQKRELLEDTEMMDENYDPDNDNDVDEADDEELEEDEEDEEGEENEQEDSTGDAEMYDIQDENFDIEHGYYKSAGRKGYAEISNSVSDAWISALTNQSGLVSADNISIDDLQYLMAQVVFDGSGLESMLKLAPNMGELEPISEADRIRLRGIYPELRSVTIAEASGSVPAMIDNDAAPSARGSVTSIDAETQPAASATPGSWANAARIGRVPSRPSSRVGSRVHSPEGSKTSSPSVVPVTSVVPLPSSPKTKTESFTLLSPPLYSVTRGDQPHKARASILRFWRAFGLQPNNEQRDISLIVLTLASPRVVNHARIGMRALKEMYESCHLGKMELPTFASVVNGILNISTDLDYTSPDTVGDLFETSCSYLKRQLQELDSDTKVVIVMAFPPGPRTSPLPLARGFRAIRATFPQVRWILCSIDSFVSKEGAEAPTSQYRLMKYALLLYDRWVPHTTINYGGPFYLPAFSLARLAPHSISIKFQPRPPSQILDDDPMMHVCYAITPDRRWVTVAWTDQWANVTKVEVLRLAGLLRTRASSPVLGLSNSDPGNPVAGPTGEPHVDRTLRNLDSVLSDIWRRTGQLCASIGDSPRNARWTVSIIKCGYMDAAEVGIWRRVADVRWEQQTQLAFPYLLHLPQTRPLNVHEGEVLFPHVSMTEFKSSGRPASPAAPATPTTPTSASAAEGRNDNVIVAALDETHGIVFKNQSQTWGISAPPLVTGVLIKPLVPAALKGYQLLEVVLVYAQAQQPTSIMKQVLGQYRRLASLAEYNGVCTSLTIMPWHVHAANKMVAALSTL